MWCRLSQHLINFSLILDFYTVRGPLITSAFVLGAGNIALLTEGLFYFLFFGLGFGWLLVVFPFVATRFQRLFTGWLTKNHVLPTRISSALLVVIGVFGIWVEVIPDV